MKLVLSTAPDEYPYLFWLRNFGLYPHKTHDVMDDSRADVFGEWLRSYADWCDPLENEPNMMTSSEDDANALDIETARKHTTFSDGSTSVFFLWLVLLKWRMHAARRSRSGRGRTAEAFSGR